MLGLYLAVPFCKSKCTYCNFASGVFPAAHHERYVARLEEDLREIRARAHKWGAVLPQAANSIYFGGGTPSLLAPSLFRGLFTSLRREFAVLPTAEITVECAPGQLDPAVLDMLVECGVNRISFGVQSFIDQEAKAIGRLHTRATALEDIRRVRDAGISDISVDLIAGLPGQTLRSWFESLGVLADSGVDHASLYMLEVDDDSRLGRELLAHGGRYRAQEVPPDDLIADMYTEAIAFLAGHGLAQYEISNFARTGCESRHNVKYWRRQPYLGFGLDAHSMLRSHAGAALRFAATDDLDTYLAGPASSAPSPLTRDEELEEAWFLGLRMNEGVSLADLRRDFSAAAVRDCLATIADLERENLVIFSGGDRVALTARGRMLSNEVFARFLQEPAFA
ncbi:MAG TPA: radical SAM family heme chaperone HemW [Acidobacteriaceae bacterium]|nr:radical SAM family heme chaperone HemW [Acidobacteriaceae bacterium]